MASSPSPGLSSFSPLGPSRGGPAGIFLFHSMPAFLHLGISTTSGGLRVECLQPSLDFSGRLHVSSFCISSPSSVQISGGTCQRAMQTFDCGCTMLDGGSLAPQSSQHVGRCSSVFCHKRSHHGCLRRSGALGLPYLHLTLWLLSNVCYADRGSLPQSVRQWWGNLSAYT